MSRSLPRTSAHGSKGILPASLRQRRGTSTRTPPIESGEPERHAARTTGTDDAVPDPKVGCPARSAFAARRLPGTSSPVMVGEAGVEPAWADGPGDFKSPPPDSQAFAGAIVTNSGSRRAAHLQRTEQNAAADTDLPPDLTQVTTAWPDLPEHIKAAILTLVQSAGEVQP